MLFPCITLFLQLGKKGGSCIQMVKSRSAAAAKKITPIIASQVQNDCSLAELNAAGNKMTSPRKTNKSIYRKILLA